MSCTISGVPRTNSMYATAIHRTNETNIQILVVKMKDELEKIKEQVLNIL